MTRSCPDHFSWGSIQYLLTSGTWLRVSGGAPFPPSQSAREFYKPHPVGVKLELGRHTGTGGAEGALPDSSDGGLQGRDHVFNGEVIPIAPVFCCGVACPGIWEEDTHINGRPQPWKRLGDPIVWSKPSTPLDMSIPRVFVSTLWDPTVLSSCDAAQPFLAPSFYYPEVQVKSVCSSWLVVEDRLAGRRSELCSARVAPRARSQQGTQKPAKDTHCADLGARQASAGTFALSVSILVTLGRSLSEPHTPQRSWRELNDAMRTEGLGGLRHWGHRLFCLSSLCISKRGTWGHGSYSLQRALFCHLFPCPGL